LFQTIRGNNKKGTLLDATFPAAVAAGNVETSQRIVDVVLGALSQVLPDDVPAASQGTMNNITIGGIDNRYNTPFTYYETIGGGMGAAEGYNGASAIQTHMTNTLNTPIEALEFAYPLEVVEYAIRKNSGGSGKYNGGDGIVRDIKLLADAEVTVLSERRKLSPYGLFGGANGSAGENVVIENNIKKFMPSKFSVKLKKYDRIIIKPQVVVDIKMNENNPKEIRAYIGQNRYTGHTSGLAKGYVQANLVVLEDAFASDLRNSVKKQQSHPTFRNSGAWKL